MQLRTTRSVAAVGTQRTRRGDRAMRLLIIGSGLSVLLLLAWVHLGLGALLFPPSATPPQMAAASGPYVVTLFADSGQLVTGDGNVVSLDIRDHAGHPLESAVVRVHADMTTMAMPVPDVSAVARGSGRYRARLLFSMAGPWRLTVTITAPGQAEVQVAFAVGVRWR